MNKYWKYTIFPVFLEDVKDCTFEKYESEDLYDILNNLTKRALQDFHFPKVSLAFSEDTTIDSVDGYEYGYYFTDNNISDAEYKVIIAFMKKYWVSAQITWDGNFKNPFFDKDIKGYSPANMLSALKEMLNTFTKEAEQARFDYGRVLGDGSATWGKINGQS
jgi:hypothetical protein